VEGGVKGVDQAVAARFLEIRVKNGVSVRGIAETALKEGVRLHFGVTCLELLGEPLIPYKLAEGLMISEEHVYRVSPAS
jgi:hypothetical protein